MRVQNLATSKYRDAFIFFKKRGRGGGRKFVHCATAVPAGSGLQTRVPTWHYLRTMQCQIWTKSGISRGSFYQELIMRLAFLEGARLWLI